MRTYGRNSAGEWVEVSTSQTGANDAVYLTTLVQNLRLAPQESPFYADNGIPAYGSIVQQILPTFYVNRIQQQFADYFTSLQITIESQDPPIYNILVVTKDGNTIVENVYI